MIVKDKYLNGGYHTWKTFVILRYYTNCVSDIKLGIF